jgi:hypothetical protein
MAAPRPQAQRRWPLIAAMVAALLLALAWINGGEQPIRPIAQSVDLPEVQQ